MSVLLNMVAPFNQIMSQHEVALSLIASLCSASIMVCVIWINHTQDMPDRQRSCTDKEERP